MHIPYLGIAGCGPSTDDIALQEFIQCPAPSPPDNDLPIRHQVGPSPHSTTTTTSIKPLGFTSKAMINCKVANHISLLQTSFFTAECFIITDTMHTMWC